MDLDKFTKHVECSWKKFEEMSQQRSKRRSSASNQGLPLDRMQPSPQEVVNLSPLASGERARLNQQTEHIDSYDTPSDDPDSLPVGPELSNEQTNTFIGKVMLVHVGLLVLSCALAVMAVRAFQITIDSDSTTVGWAKWAMRLILAKERMVYVWFLYLIALGFTPFRNFRGMNAKFVGLLTCIILTLMIMSCSVWHRSEFMHSLMHPPKVSNYKNEILGTDDKAASESSTPLTQEHNKHQEEIKREEEAQQHMVDETFNENKPEIEKQIYVLVDQHIIRGIVGVIISYMAVIIASSGPETDFLHISKLAVPVIVGTFYHIYNSMTFPRTRYWNIFVGTWMVIFPTLYTLRLQRWISGRVKCVFRTDEHFDAAMTLIADTFKIIMYDLADAQP